MASSTAPSADVAELPERTSESLMGADSPPLVPGQGAYLVSAHLVQKPSPPSPAAARMRRKRERERNGERVWQFTFPDELVDDFLTLNGVSETTPLTVEERVELQERLNQLLIQAMRDRASSVTRNNVLLSVEMIRSTYSETFMFGLTALLPPKPPALVDAEKALEAHNFHLATLHKEQSQLDAAVARFAGRETVSEQTAAQRKRLTAIRDELRGVYEEVNVAQRAVSEHRQPYARSLASHFAAKRKHAAEQILIALAAIEFQVSLLKDTASQIDRAGGRVTHMPEIIGAPEVRVAAELISKEI